MQASSSSPAWQPGSTLDPRLDELLVGQPLLVEDGAVVVEGQLDELLRRLTERATTLLRTCLPDGPRLEVHLAPPWSGTNRLQVLAVDAASDANVSLDALSAAEHRWSGVAIQLAVLAETRSAVRSVLLLDEPEAGLHPLARRDAAAGLEVVAHQLGATIVLASHAVEFLSLNIADVWHVERTGPLADVQPLPSEQLLRLALPAGDGRLGLTPAEALSLVRLFVVVEGAHDEALLTRWLANELAAAQARVVTMRGTHNLNTVMDLQVLMDFTEARVLVVLDRTRPELRVAWERVLAVPPAERLATVDAERRRLDRGRGLSQEEEKLFELFRSAAKRGGERLSVYGLQAPDVLEYLPAKGFDPRPDVTWALLVQEWGRRGTARAGSGPGAPRSMPVDSASWSATCLCRLTSLSWDERSSRRRRGRCTCPRPGERGRTGAPLRFIAALIRRRGWQAGTPTSHSASAATTSGAHGSTAARKADPVVMNHSM